jgi:hypothetical protein
MIAAKTAVLLLSIVGLLCAWGYFRRVRINRPPLGTFGLGDVAMLLIAVVVVPFLYLIVPVVVASILLGVGALSVLALALEPVIPIAGARWAVIVVVLAGNVFLTTLGSFDAWIHFVANDVVLLLIVIGTSNLWAQSGLRARDAAVLGAGLALYDFVFTAVLPTTNDLIARLADLPFAPIVGWPTGTDQQWVAIGLGDLLLAAVFPLVMRKAFGRVAGLAALAINVGVIVVLMLVPLSGTFPVMVIIGPLMVVQFFVWTQRRGHERTTWQYLLAEPLPSG